MIFRFSFYFSLHTFWVFLVSVSFHAHLWFFPQRHLFSCHVLTLYYTHLPVIALSTYWWHPPSSLAQIWVCTVPLACAWLFPLASNSLLCMLTWHNRFSRFSSNDTSVKPGLVPSSTKALSSLSPLCTAVFFLAPPQSVTE